MDDLDGLLDFEYRPHPRDVLFPKILRAGVEQGRSRQETADAVLRMLMGLATPTWCDLAEGEDVVNGRQ